MKTPLIKGRRGKGQSKQPVMPKWNVRRIFTKPNGVFEHNKENQLTFVPNKLPPTVNYDQEMITLLVQAERKIGELKGKGTELPNPYILARAYLKQEAVWSSKIEGTLASLDDLNKYEAVGNIKENESEYLRLREVANYVEALEYSLKKIHNKHHEIDLNLIKTAHKKLLTNVRGQDKFPGEFRKIQNWIIRTNGAKNEIVYTPPLVERLPKLLSDLEKFIQSDSSQLSPLIECAMVHYQFESIHPFGDGNGRIGRLLLPLILYKRGLLPEPLLYISEYIDKHKQQYYKGLQAVSQKSKWDDWIKFFLMAFAEQADDTIINIKKLSTLRQKYKDMFKEKNRNGKIMELIDKLFSNPYMTIPRAKRLLNTTYPTAKATVMQLVKAGILEQTNMTYRNKVFLAREIDDNLQNN